MNQSGLSHDAAREYAEGVVAVLATEFASLSEPRVREVAVNTIMDHAVDPVRLADVILDNPTAANWRVIADHNPPWQVRLACFKATLTDADKEFEDRINWLIRGFQPYGED